MSLTNVVSLRSRTLNILQNVRDFASKFRSVLRLTSRENWMFVITNGNFARTSFQRCVWVELVNVNFRFGFFCDAPIVKW